MVGVYVVMENNMKTRADTLHVPEFYIGKRCCYDGFGVGDVRLVYSSRFEGIESTGWVGDILSLEDEVGFLENNIMGAVRFFEDTLGIFGKQGYVLHNGVQFRPDEGVLLSIPSFLEERIQYELRDVAHVELVQREQIELRDAAHVEVVFRHVVPRRIGLH